MSKHWKDVKAAIEKDIDRIWFEEPEEVKMSRLGIFPSGAGSHDQVLPGLRHSGYGLVDCWPRHFGRSVR